MKVCIDSGHGQYDNHGVDGYREGTWMWYLGNYIGAEFIRLGHSVTFTRPKITDNPGLFNRGIMARGHDLFLSIHSNANGNPSKEGPSIYDSVEDKVDVFEKHLVALIADVMDTVNNGVFHRYYPNSTVDDYYGVLRGAIDVGCPDAMLIEHGYHTNPKNARWLMNHDNLKRLAKAEVGLITGGAKEELLVVKVGTVVNVNSSLRVRSSTSTANTSNVVGNLLNGEQVPVLEEGTWNKIIFNDAVAYAHSDYMEVTELGTGGNTGITQAELDAEKARTAQEKARADSALASLAKAKTDLSVCSSELDSKNKALKTIGAGWREAQKY